MDFFEPPADVATVERVVAGAPVHTLLQDVLAPEAYEMLHRIFHRELGDRGRWVFESGADTLRERIWVQADSAAASPAASLAAVGILLGIAGSGTSRYRQLALARSRFALCAPAAVPPARVESVPPLFDCGETGARAAVSAALDAYRPTFVLQLQDWGGESGPAAVRLVESFMVQPDLHQRIEGARWRRWGRPTQDAKALDAHPDARVGRLATRYAGRLGARIADSLGNTPEIPDAVAAIHLGPGRFTVKRPWRLLGGATLCELALTRNGAPGICVQAAGGTHAERAAALLAVAEGAVLHRLGLESQETPR